MTNKPQMYKESPDIKWQLLINRIVLIIGWSVTSYCLLYALLWVVGCFMGM